MKTLISFFVMLMMLMNTAPQQQTNELVGVWTGEQDITEEMNDSFASDPMMAEHLSISKFSVLVTMTFSEDGTYSMTVDRDALNNTMHQMMDDLKPGMEAYLTAVLAEELAAEGVDMSVEDLLAQQGMTMDDLMAEMYNEDMLEDVASAFETYGRYKVEDGKLYLFTSEYGEIDPDIYSLYTLHDSVDGEVLTITDPALVSSGYNPDMVFTRVS